MVAREDIVEAALRLAATRGFGSLSVRRVAAEAGVGATTLRRVFPVQGELRLVVAAELARRHHPADLSIADDTRDPAHRLFACLAQLLPAAGRTVAVEAWFELRRMAEGAEPVPGARAAVAGERKARAERLRRWLTVLAGQGHVAPGEIEGQVFAALALVDGVHLNALLHPGDLGEPGDWGGPSDPSGPSGPDGLDGADEAGRAGETEEATGAGETAGAGGAGLDAARDTVRWFAEQVVREARTTPP
ncbi:TetR family transcriptional regulator [Streptomyces sp. NPDC093085]|uniref:TetR/AcrR family transcriptional regulator n=1 Tax=Streptomyces sp. NPDC093085 TaxID=3155068 RepID=UPI0034421FC5